MADDNRRNSKADNDMDTDANEDAGFDSDEEGGLRINEDIYIPPPPKKYHEQLVDEPRLMIDKIVNENFKSYAGEVVIGKFSECFTCIIGPNGSGKSNIIDSMLFVFGYRSSKIRSKKISSLIHNSCNHPNLNKCRVSIHFRRVIDRTNGTVEAVPDSAIVISRVAFKDNTSYYELNGRRVQFKEIAKLLRGENVDLDHNRFLILQGEVEQIAMMKPKGQNENDEGMLEFLEDIIGTSRYKLPLEKLSETLEEMTERRMMKLQRLRRVEAEQTELKEFMDDAVEYLKMENNITKLHHQLYHCKRAETIAEIAERQETKKEMDADYEKLIETMKNIDDEKTTKTKELKEKCKKWDVLQKQKDAATAKYDEMRKKDETLYAELVETNKRRKANMAKLKTETASLEDLERVPEKNAKKIEECEELETQSADIRTREQAALDKLMEQLSKKTAPLLDERQKHETKLISLRKDVDQAKGTFDLAESELNIYTSVEKTEKSKLDELREALHTTTETLKERKQQLTSLKTKIPATAESLQKATRELDTVKAKEIEVGSKLKNLRTDFEEKRSAMNASRSRNATIDALMKEKRAGRIPGIFGRLGDLGAIDAKYDVAISTACGPLDNVVVDTAETAERCIKFLRENNVGRATFIPLEKQQRYLDQCRQKSQYPEKVPRLFDLVRVEDDRVLVAFYFGLRNTLVANDLNQATRIAYGPQRYRVVTLKGELIEIAGTMSGGGKSVMRGRMGQSVVRSEPTTVDIENLQSNLDAVYEEYNSLRSRQQPLEEQIRTLTTAQRDMIAERDKCQVEVNALTTQQPSLQAQIKVQEKKVAASTSKPEKLRKLTDAVDVAREKLTIVEELSRETEIEVTRLSKEIDAMSGGRIKDGQKKIADLTKTIEKAKAEVVRLRVAVKTADRDAKKCKQRMENLETDVKKCENRLREIQQERTDLEDSVRTILDGTKELDEALVERDEIAGSLKEELNALNSRESKLKAVKIDLDQKMTEQKNVLRTLEKMIPDYTRKIASLELREVPDTPQSQLVDLTDDEVRELNVKTITTNLQRAKENLPEEIPNMQIIKDYQATRTIYLEQAKEVTTITEERNKLRDVYNMARERRCEEFLAGFAVITDKLKEMYQMITKDGDAELELVDSMDPFNEGVVFSVRPPKKSWKNISNLSGGEKTISSLVLVFALHHYKPSPLYFMDEIDAALDFKNTSIIGHYIKQRAKNSQFIVVSLREEMFGLSNILVGIYKTYDTSKMAMINLDSYAKAHGSLCLNQNAQALQNRRGPGAMNSATQLPTKETVAVTGSTRNDPQIPATCPAAIEDATPLAPAVDPNHSFGLGDLNLPETPEKTPRRRRGSSSDSAVSDTSEKRSTRKRRRN